MVLVGLLAVPVVAAFSRDGDGGPDRADESVIAAPSEGDGSIVLIDASETTTTTTVAPVVTAPITEPPTQAPATNAPAATAAATTAPAATVAVTSARATAPPTSRTQSAEALAAPTTTEASCREYEAGAGDYWIGIADRAGVSMRDLLDANQATTDTPIYPGSTICLPAGARDPGPPPAPTTTTTQAPTTTAKPTTTTAKPTTTTAAPTTTAKPTTTTAAPTTTQPSKTYTRDEVTAIITSVFPADQVETALKIAQRESNLQPGVRNWCCYGLFQLNWNSHKSWLAGFGVTSPEQLYDPQVNAEMALALYERAGGWGPWGGVPS